MKTQFKSLSPDHSVAELLALKIKQEAEHIQDDKINAIKRLSNRSS